MTNSVLERSWTIVVAFVLVTWFLASVIHQFRFHWWIYIARFDFLNLLPRWTFFAPNPGRHDFHVVFRNWTDDQPDPWIELVVTEVDRRWRWIWHPSRYCNKAISDLVNSLYNVIQSNRQNPRAVMFSPAYISLLYLVMAQPMLNLNVSHRQFAIIVTQGFEGNRPIEIKYISEGHRVEH